MSAAFEAWWAAYGTMGVRIDIRRTSSSPSIDLTTINKASVRVWDAETLQPVVTLDAQILPGATANAISIRAIPTPGQIPPGQYQVAGLISPDDGVTFYPTGRSALPVTPPVT